MGLSRVAFDRLPVKVRWPRKTAGIITGRFAMESYRELLLGKGTGDIKSVIRVAA